MRLPAIVVALWCFLPFSAYPGQNPLPSRPHAQVEVYPAITEATLSPGLFGINLAYHTVRANLIAQPETIPSVTAMQIESVRFPNGCFADRYDWRNASAKNLITVEQFLDFCDAIGAEPYYTINMQGGTEGLEGPIPDGAPLSERIKYQHTAPNPCGWTDYHYGTLAEAVELVEIYTCQRMLDGKKPIINYEMGNENWGQAKTDWPFDVYAATIKEFAIAMENAVSAWAAVHPELERVDLRITAVGFPIMGNNQDPLQYMDRDINVGWTAALNDLYGQGIIDAVQEHFYPFGWGGGRELFWTMHNLENIFYTREGIPNPRLDGYVDPELKYDMPMEITEWNVKCWGNAPQYDIIPDNPGFENGLNRWSVDGTPGQYVIEISTANVCQGTHAARISLTDAGGFAEIFQSKSIGTGKEGFHAAGWVWTSSPDVTHLILRQSNPGEHAGAIIKDVSPNRIKEWQWIVWGGDVFPDTTDVELAARIEGGTAEVYLDATKFVYWNTKTNTRPMSADTYAQRLFAIDAFRVMMKHNVPTAHWHHLIGDYPCGCLESDGDLKPNYRIFEFFAGRRGTRLVRTTCEAERFDFKSYWDEWATDFNALPPSTNDLPVLSALATADNNNTYLLLVNPLTDRDVEVDIVIHARDVGDTAHVRTFQGKDYTIDDARILESSVRTGREFTHVVPAHSAEILTLETADSSPQGLLPK